MITVSISDETRTRIPHLMLSCIEADVVIREDDRELWAFLEEKSEEIADTLKLEDISGLPAVAASRHAYRQCGKDPARYRLSAEALLRRIVQGKGLYRVNNVVDLLNLTSVTTGFSIGGYDAGMISGEVIFDIGRANEPYQGIGRGHLNIESMPVFRDRKGAFGSPTSDSTRTSITGNTSRFLMIIIDFGSISLLNDATRLALKLLREHAAVVDVETQVVGRQ